MDQAMAAPDSRFHEGKVESLLPKSAGCVLEVWKPNQLYANW